MNVANIPQDLRRIIDGESTDFIVKAKRKNIPSSSLGIFFFGLFWTAFSSLFVAIFFGPLFLTGEVHFEANGVPTTATLDNLTPMIMPGLLIGLFLLIGFVMLGFGIYRFVQEGGYFVGTPTRFIQYRNDEVVTTNWEQFSGNMRLKNKGESGHLVLELRTGKMVSRKNSGSRYVPKQIELVGIPNVYKIEKYCRERIEEHDPTPVERGYRS